MYMLTFTTLSVLSRRRHTAFSTRWRASTVPSVGSGAGTLTTAAKKNTALRITVCWAIRQERLISGAFGTLCLRNGVRFIETSNTLLRGCRP